MQLKSFEIQNFRSIKYVKCYVSPKITLLAGKNESGKTNILLALQRLRTKFTDDDIPRTSNKDDKTFVECNFVISKKEIESVLGNIDVSIDYEHDSAELIVKTTPKVDYQFSGNFYNELKNTIEEPARDAINDFNNLIQEMKDQSEKHGGIKLEAVTSLESNTVETNSSQLSAMQQQLTQNPAMWGGSITMDKITSTKSLLTQLNSHVTKMANLHLQLEELIPGVVYFDSFEDKLPPEMDLIDAIKAQSNTSEYNIVSDFVKLSGLDLESLKNPDRQHRAQATNKATRISSEIFGKYWKQDPIDIEISYDEPKLTFFVKDRGDDYPFKPEQRSKGMQWFMCFLARLKATGSEENNLILIDEPGLYLHAQAQQDVLDLLEEITGNNNQIVFATHSPYLIDTSKLNRIRLVIKNKSKKITELENQFNKNADIETITPIVTAIGLDLSKGVAFAKKRNILVEGVSDYYYIVGMKKYLEKNRNYKFPEDIAIIPCVGESKTSLVASLLIGYGLDYKILLDKKGTRHTHEKLEEEGLTDKILTLGITSSESIEDQFSTKDKEKYTVTEDNLSKTLTSKTFYEKVESGEYVDFTETTVKNFIKLLDDITK